MHGQKNTQICDAKQTKQVHLFKNTKIKLCKCNAVICITKSETTHLFQCDYTRCCIIQY